MELQPLLELLTSTVINLWEERENQTPEERVKSEMAYPKENEDYYTGTDLSFEQRLVDVLEFETPDIPILSEELNPFRTNKGTYFTVDAVDGTWNFKNHIPLYGTQIALVQDYKPVMGLIYLPVFKEVYSAISGEGATLNGEPIHVHGEKVTRSVISVPDFRRRSKDLDNQLKIARYITNYFGKPRLFGSTAFDLAQVAKGTLQGKVSIFPNVWDIAPGSVIIREAGGTVIFRNNIFIGTAKRGHANTLYRTIENYMKIK